MMREKIRLTLFVFGLASYSMSVGQDGSYFVKISGDTINCEITRITSNFLFYQMGEMRSRVELSSVIFYHEQQPENIKGVDSSVMYQPEMKEANQDLVEDFIGDKPRERVRLLSNVGLGYRVGRAPPSIPKDYMQQLRLGSDFDLRLQVFERDNGLGLEYNQFYSNSEGNIPGSGAIVENILITYYGLSWIFRKMEKNGNVGYASLGLGALFYDNEGFIDGQELAMNGATLGLRINYDYSIAINKFIYLGLNFDVILGTLTQIEINGVSYTAQNPEDGENVSRVNLGAGIRFSI